MTDDEIISVVQAHKEGKIIQQKSYGGYWVDCAFPLWNFHSSDYRVAPEPRKPREWWIDDTSGRGTLADNAWRKPMLRTETIHVREVIE